MLNVRNVRVVTYTALNEKTNRPRHVFSQPSHDPIVISYPPKQIVWIVIRSVRPKSVLWTNTVIVVNPTYRPIGINRRDRFKNRIVPEPIESARFRLVYAVRQYSFFSKIEKLQNDFSTNARRPSEWNSNLSRLYARSRSQRSSIVFCYGPDGRPLPLAPEAICRGHIGLRRKFSIRLATDTTNKRTH